jgi:PAS domain S-box-containing protein
MIVTQPTAILGAALGSALLALALLYLRSVDGNRALGWWAAAVFANTGQEVIQLTGGIIPPGLPFYLAEVGVALKAALFLAGTLRFLKRPRFDGAILVLFLAAVAWATFAAVEDLPFFARTAPIHWLAGVAMILTGLAFVRAKDGDLTRGYQLIGLAFIAWGAHFCDYPLLRPIKWFAPWGYVLAECFSLGIAASLILMVHSRQAKALGQATRLAQTSAQGRVESEERFRDFAEISSDWLWEMDADLRFTYLSDNLRRSLGVNPQNGLGKRREEIHDLSRDPEKWQAHFADLAARRPFRDFRYAYRLPNGHDSYISISGKPLFDAAGKFTGYRGTGRDITREVDADRRAGEAQTRLAAAFESLANGIALFDRDDRLIVCNPAYRRFTGLDDDMVKPGVSLEQLLRARVARKLMTLQPGEDIESFIAKRAARDRTVHPPFERQQADGSWILIYEQLFAGGRVVTSYDITALKAREKELGEKTRLLESTLEYMGEGISVYDPDLKMIAWNERLIDMVGLPREMYKIGTPLEDIVRYSAERGEYGSGNIEGYVRDRVGQSKQPVPHRNARWRFNGRYVELRRNPMPDGGFVTVYSDLTERKRAEDALREAKEAAEAANKTKSEILANMSHELRTPLNAIIGFSDIIQREAFGSVGEQRYLDYARDIHDSGAHLLALINDILDVSKAEAGRIELLEGLVDVTELFESCVRLVRARAEEAHVTIEALPTDRLPKLNADGLRLKQVLLNLLSNAIKFTPAGGRVTLDADMGDQKRFVIRVTDTGIGMAPEDIPKALSPFGQLESTRARRYPGTGLGLPLSKALIELHGGELRIESEAGKGTAVIVTLPAARVLAA